MTILEPKAGEQVRGVSVTNDAISVDLLDGRTITVPLAWGQGRRQPQGPAKSLLRIAENHPEILAELR